MLSDHREALHVHRLILDRQRETNRRQLTLARQTLQQERARTRRAAFQYQRDFEHARAEAQEYRLVWLKARREGAHLLRFVDRFLKRAA